MITVKVLKISYQPSTRNYFILLKDVDSDNCIPLTIGSFEAQSIALALESIEEKRPMTHDLICHLFSEIGFSLKSVRITDLKDDVFYSVIDIESKISALNDNFIQQLDDNPDELKELFLSMQMLVTRFKADMFSFIGVSPDYADNDGDGG